MLRYNPSWSTLYTARPAADLLSSTRMLSAPPNRVKGCRPLLPSLPPPPFPHAPQVNLFEGTCYLTPLLGAWLADSLWGRYKTILFFSCIYFMVRAARAMPAAVAAASGAASSSLPP